jgi:hypothetical protein
MSEKCKSCNQIKCVCAEIASTFRADGVRFSREFDEFVTRRRNSLESLERTADYSTGPQESQGVAEGLKAARESAAAMRLVKRIRSGEEKVN